MSMKKMDGSKQISKKRSVNQFDAQNKENLSFNRQEIAPVEEEKKAVQNELNSFKNFAEKRKE